MTQFELPITDLESIEKLLPHRHPMIMVDALLDFNEGKATVRFKVTTTNLFVDANIFAETGLIEHMAQAAALYTGFKNHSAESPIKEGFIASIKKLQIKKLPEVGDVLITEVEILHQIMHLTTVKLSTFSNGAEIAYAEMNTVLKTDA